MVNKDVRGSPEVMEMNVDLMSMGVNVAMNDTNSQPTNSTAHGKLMILFLQSWISFWLL